MDLERQKINFDIPYQSFNQYRRDFRFANKHLGTQCIKFCINYAKALKKKNLPIIYNLEHLSHHVKLSKKSLYFIIKQKEKFYQLFEIPKKKEGVRNITAPSKILKNVQRWILDCILYNIDIHKNATGFYLDKSIIKNANFHLNQKMVLNIDLKDFFPSIKNKRTYHIFSSCGYNHSVCKILSELCTFNNELPQGSPASPMISNIVCKSLDSRLFGFCKKNNLNYSRYADDITISGERNLTKYILFIFKIIENEGFKISTKKIRLTGRGNAQIVTGITVNDKISFDRKKLRKIRAIIHNCKKIGPEKANKNKHPFFREYLYGYVAFLKPIKPELSKKWKKELDSIDWGAYKKKYDVDIIINDSEKELSNPTAFISYSWDSKKHREWVIRFAANLIKNGINVLIDEWDLKDYNDDLNYFIECGIRDSNHVIIICTPKYAKKANKRLGGAGIETAIITGEIYEKTNAGKFIPIALNYQKSMKECLPTYLKNKFTFDFNEEERYEEKIELLLRKIYKKPKYKKPKLGTIPDFKSKDI
ncbi:MAG: TIR domain-containing protein [Candidatus Lokiarchaeota archaeon]|nr:TIR domain-containing protein [Candidatus Lokiarchaeota archaeon]